MESVECRRTAPDRTAPDRTAPDRTDMQRFDGTALLPWTRQMLCVLWEQLRLLVQIIYYSFMSVFQMFRFEVHLRITDETGQHVQHMSTAASPAESFLFSSLFDGDNGVMVGGSNPLSNFCADVGDPFPGTSPAEALLSSLRADDLCCVVDDFVSRTTGNEDGIFLGHHPSWKMGFPGDWNIFVSSTDGSGKSDARHVSTDTVFEFKHDASEEEKSSHWSSEEDHNMGDFDSEESKALWESLSKSNDPYNPFFFSACISTNAAMGTPKAEARDDREWLSPSKTSEDLSGPRGQNFWGARSDSESSWGSSDGSCGDLDKEESERLWEFFNSPLDPYNPMCFTACALSTAPHTTTTATKTPPRSQETPQASLPAPRSDTDTEEKDSSFAPSSSEDEEEEQLWKSLCQNDDPYHPLNFQACLQTSPTTHDPPELHSWRDSDASLVPPTQAPPSHKQSGEEVVTTRRTRATKPALKQRHSRPHCHPNTTLVPWKKAGRTSGPAPGCEASTTHKKVRFSPLVQVHVMRTWLFARQASRKGPWEETARDRDRFRRRVQDAERDIGYCFTPSHREKIRAHLDETLRSDMPSSL